MGRHITLPGLQEEEDQTHWSDLSEVKLMNAGEKDAEILRLRKALRRIMDSHLGNAFVDQLARDALAGKRV